MEFDDLFSNSNEKLNNEENENSALDLDSFSSSAVDNRVNDKVKKIKKKEQIIKTVLITFLIGVISVSIAVGSFLIYVFTAVDGTMEENLNDLTLNFTTTVYTKNNSGDWDEYQRLHGEFNRIWLAYDETAAKEKAEGYEGIPQQLVDAFVAIEDKRFFLHPGVDWKRTAKGFLNLLTDNASDGGGSTITQQLVKNLTMDNDRKISRKIREIMRARYLEKNYAKPTIMECYLNTIPLGHGTYGVEVAANYYFGKSANELSLLECATLASITKSPTYYAPDTYPDNNETRRKTVLYQMLDQGYITQEEYDNALKEELKIIASREELNESEINSYFIEALIKQVSEDLAEKYGYEPEEAVKNFYNGGYKIYSTLNPDIQSKIESVFVDSASYGLVGADGSQLQGAFTIMDYQGQVVGLVGGIGEKTVNLGISGFNRATDAIRQPGSTMKPISAYGLAIEEGLINYSTIVKDEPTNYNGWTPKNWYSGYSGSVTVEHALERSINTIPVALVKKLTPQASFDFLTKKLGVTTLNNPEDIDLSPLGLGGSNGGITTLESAAAYAVFGNGGTYYEPTLYTKVCDQHGDVILEYKPNTTTAISEDTATVMNHLLRNVIYGANGTGKGVQSYISNMDMYAKTGTTNDQYDLWFVGGTPYYVASCWCGYDSQQRIPQSSVALRMWGSVMGKIHAELPAKEFENSSYASDKYYCTETGMLANDTCPSKAIGWYKKENNPKDNYVPDYCTTHEGTPLGAPTYEENSEQGEGAESTTQSGETTSQ